MTTTRACACYIVTVERLAQDGEWETESRKIIDASLPYGSDVAGRDALQILRSRIERSGSYDHHTGHMVGKTIVTDIRPE